MKRIWCAQAWLGGDSLTPGVLVSVDDDGKISALTHQGQPPADVEALRGRNTLRGARLQLWGLHD